MLLDSPLQGTPAARAGIKANDLIIKVNGKLVQNMTLREAVNHIKGERGTKVTLTVIRKGEKKPINLTITRDIIKLVTVKKKLLENFINNVSNTNKIREFIDNEVSIVKEELSKHLPKVKDKVTKIKLTEAIKQIVNLTKGRVVEEKQVLTMMRYYELVKEIKNVHLKK